MVKCIASVKYTMTALVIPKVDYGNDPSLPGTEGSFKRVQDPDSGQITTVFEQGPTQANTATRNSFQIDLYARGYTDLGFRSSANLESYLKGQYQIREVIEAFWPTNRLNDNIGRQALITEIRDKRTGQLMWVEQDTGVATTFQVQGVTPVMDPFGRMKEYISVLTRAEIQ